MDIAGAIVNGYLRLYCKIKLPGKWLRARGLKIPKRCRVCYGELDAKYKARRAGRLCLECYRAKNVWRTKLYYQQNSERLRKKARARYYLDKDKAAARAKANYKLKERQVCQVLGCNNLGIRHHEDYSKPLDVIWLCYEHHYQWHRGGVDKSSMEKYNGSRGEIIVST